VGGWVGGCVNKISFFVIYTKIKYSVCYWQRWGGRKYDYLLPKSYLSFSF